jgi:CheY-like chemotaxis protein
MTMVRGRFLVVDDHIDLAENLAEILGAAGVEAVTAASAEAGLQVIEAGGIAALITDYRLPGRNGAQFISELRRRGNTIPAIVMSAYTDDDTIGAARAAGAVRVLAKPIDLEQLMFVVQTLGAA